MSVRPFYLVGTFFSRTMLLDLGRGLCHLHNQDSPLLCTTDMTPDSCAALISECTTTPPFWEAHCTVKLIPSAANLYAPHGDSGLLEPYQMDWDGTAVAHTLPRADSGLTVVCVMTPTNTPIGLQPGMQLGQFIPVSDNEICTDTPSVCQVTAPSVSSQSSSFDVRCNSPVSVITVFII